MLLNKKYRNRKLAIRDTFADPDGTLLTAHIPDVYPVGSSYSSLSVRTTDYLMAQILSGRITPNAVGSYGAKINSGVSDYTLSCAFNTGFHPNSFRVAFRWEDKNNCWFTAVAGTALTLYEITGGTLYTRATKALTWVEFTDYTLTVICVGPSITIKVGGGLSSIVSYTSSLHQLGIYVGPALVAYSNSTGYIDNFVVTA